MLESVSELELEQVPVVVPAVDLVLVLVAVVDVEQRFHLGMMLCNCNGKYAKIDSLALSKKLCQLKF